MAETNGHLKASTKPASQNMQPILASAEMAQWFAREVQPHEPLLRAFLRRSVPCLADVDDLMQDCYLRVLRAQEREACRSSKAFLFSVARNAVCDFHRRRAVVKMVDVTETACLNVLTDDSPGTADEVSRRQEQSLLAEAIRELPERCRQVFLLRKIQELPQKEIAARLGITENTVQTLVARGMLRCAEYLRKRCATTRK